MPLVNVLWTYQTKTIAFRLTTKDINSKQPVIHLYKTDIRLWSISLQILSFMVQKIKSGPHQKDKLEEHLPDDWEENSPAA